jgi:hypothetical protein
MYPETRSDLTGQILLPTSPTVTNWCSAISYVPYDIMGILQFENHRVGALIFTIFMVIFHYASFARADFAPPKRVAFYYGFPSAVNEAKGNVDRAVDAFKDFDLVVFGDTVEFPQFRGAASQVSNFGCTQNSHNDHDNAQAIIDRLQDPSGHTHVFGYVSVGGENTYRACTQDGLPVPLTLGQIKERIDLWAAMNVTGVFFDEAEYGFGSSRKLQNAAVEYAHAKLLRAFINGYSPHDVFSTQVLDRVTYSAGALQGKLSAEPMNGLGERSVLGRNDIYLLEHYQLLNGNFDDGAAWTARADAAANYHKSYGTQIATLTTQADVYPKPAKCDDLFSQFKYDYAWWSTLLYGFDYMSWGEPSGFSAWGTCANKMPAHQAPAIGPLGNLTSDVMHPSAGSSVHSRRTKNGLIEVDSTTHIGRFVPT